ncbi:MAG TPA: flagellar biosynthesis protein FlhB [bacterium]
MAEESFQEKTEQPTGRRLQETREKGQVAKSAELNSALILITGIMMLYFTGGTILSQLLDQFKIVYGDLNGMSREVTSVQSLMSAGLKPFVAVVAPLLIVLTIVAIGSNVAQFGFLFTTEPLLPKFDKLNPLAGFKRLFSARALVELLKSIFKLVIVGGIAYSTLLKQSDRYLLLLDESVGEILYFTGAVVYQLTIRISGALLVMALFDFYYQKWQHKKDLMMTKEEVKEEAKQMEGDPLVKSAIRSLQMTRARQRMMGSVPEADVVITNPTHLAVAMKYDVEKMNAPVILAKGARLLAARIREIAQRHGIPIVENKPLAQSLYKIGEPGKEIPVELFHAVAEVFAHVYQMRNRK